MAYKAMIFPALSILVHDHRTFFRRLKRLFRRAKKPYHRHFQMTLKQWLLYHQKNIVFKQCHWMGVRMLKNPFDAWIYQEIIYEIKPDVIVEIGSCEGGSTLYLANLLDLLGKGLVISIDIDRTRYRVTHNRINTITGDSSSPETIRKVFDLCKGKSTLVIHDGDHTKENVLKDLKAYSNLVSKNSYFIIEDGIIDLFTPGDSIGDFRDGPLAAIDEFLRENSNYAIDTERERYILTYNPHGFLKRIR